MTRRNRLLAGLALLLLFAAGTAIWWGLGGNRTVRGLRARMEHPRIILVTFDTLNVWYTSLFSEDGAPTPNLEALAEEGVLFERSYTPVPLTVPSHTVLLSGRPPWSTGVLANGDTVPEELTTLPEILSDHGYRTAAFVSLAVLNSKFQLARGFEVYDDVREVELARGYRTAAEVLTPARDWIMRNADEPFLVWIHFSDPHGPYLPVGAPPDTRLRLDRRSLGLWSLGSREQHSLTFKLPPGQHRLVWERLEEPVGGIARPTPLLEIVDAFDLGRYAAGPLEEELQDRRLDPGWGIVLRNDQASSVEVSVTFTGRSVGLTPEWVRKQYRSEVSYADRHLGELDRLLEDLGLSDDTLWLIASDHGEGLFHHGAVSHAPHTREDQLRTLWIVAGAGIPQGKRIGDPVLIQDFLPTVLDVLKLPLPKSVEGASRASCWGTAGCGGGRPEWIAYGIDNKQRALRSFALYRWPLKALWSRKTSSGVFDLLKQPREKNAVVDLSEHLTASDGTTLESPTAAMLQRLEKHVGVFRGVLGEGQRESLDAEDRRMLKSLGYL